MATEMRRFADEQWVNQGDLSRCGQLAELNRIAILVDIYPLDTPRSLAEDLLAIQKGSREDALALLSDMPDGMAKNATAEWIDRLTNGETD